MHKFYYFFIHLTLKVTSVNCRALQVDDRVPWSRDLVHRNVDIFCHSD